MQPIKYNIRLHGFVLFDLFVFSSIVFFFFFFWFFVSFVFTGVQTIPLKDNCHFQVGVRVWVSFRVRARIGGIFSLGAIVLEPFLLVEKKEIFTCQQNVTFHSSIICAKLHHFVDTKWTKWSKLDVAHIFETSSIVNRVI